MVETLEEVRSKIQSIRARIVDGDSRGEDISAHIEALKKARLEERAAQDAELYSAEVVELSKIAAERLERQKQAHSIQERVTRQAEAVQAFLVARDKVSESLKAMATEAQALVSTQAACWREYASSEAFRKEAGQVPAGYLPKAFSCPFLAMKDSKTFGLHLDKLNLVEDLSDWAQLLDGMVSNPVVVAGGDQTEATEEGTVEAEPAPGTPCKVCQHPDRAAIESALASGASLRDIAGQYGVSKSTVDRHKAHIGG